jgi:hypothetical protein
MERRRFVTTLRDDDLRCRRKWTLAFAAFYIAVLGLLGSAAWLSARPSGADMGQTAMAGRIFPPTAPLSLASPRRDTK